MPLSFVVRGLAALIVFALVRPAAAQPAPEPYVFSERVGPTLDPEERAYFGLFPGVRDFERAQAETVPDGGVRVVIERSTAPDSVLTMGRATAELLGRFVETFEQYEAVFYNPAWQVISAYGRTDVRVPYVRGRDAVVVEVDGGRYAGQPYYVSDSLILLAPDETSFDWRTAAELVLLRAEDIQRVQVETGWVGQPWVPAVGAGLGLTLDLFLRYLKPNDAHGIGRTMVLTEAGAFATRLASSFLTRRRTYENALGELEQAAWFTPEAYPAGMLPPRELASEAGSQAMASPSRWRSMVWLGIGMSGGSGDDEFTYDFFSNFDASDTLRTTKVLGARAAVTATGLMRPLPWLSLGASFYDGSLPELGNIDFQEVAVSRQTFRAFAVLDPVRMVWPRSRFGLGLGGGVIRGESLVAQRIPANSATRYTPERYEIRESGIGPYLVVTAEVTLPFDAALYGGIERWAAPEVEVPTTEVQSVAFPGPIVYRVQRHRVKFERIGVVAGVRVGI